MTPAMRAAERFRHKRVLFGYAKGKTKWDPAYAAVADLLRTSNRALLDIGCGVGLLAAYLRESGCRQPILGIEPDEEKIRVAVERVAGAYPSLAFRVGDARALPEFSGDIVMLDVLHYMGPDVQRSVLEQIASRVCPNFLGSPVLTKLKTAISPPVSVATRVFKRDKLVIAAAM